MALQVEQLHFTLRTGTGTQTIPLVRYPSLRPKAIIFNFLGPAIDGFRTSYGYGFDDGTNHIGDTVSFASTFGVLASAKGYYSSHSIVAVTAQAFGGVANRVSGYVSALNIGSFEITIDNNLLPGSDWHATIIGGDDVECAVGIYDVTPGSGTVNVGFDPVAVLKLSAPDAGSNGENTGADHSYGFGTACGTDHQVGWGITANAITSASSSFQIEDVIQQTITVPGSTTISAPVTISFVTNGFDVTVSGSPVWNIGYLAIGGSAVSANLVQIIQPTTTGLQNVAIDATDPVAVFFGSTCKPATSGAGSVDANLMFGIYDGLSQFCAYLGSVNGASSPFEYGGTESFTKAIRLSAATGPNDVTEKAAATVTLASQNIAVTWTKADATQREIWALVLAQNLSGTTNPCGQNPQASITVVKHCTPIAGGETEFPFGTTGGLSPSTFNLMDGETQLFSSVSPGTYGITESAPTGWTASYAVSNGDSHDAITVTGTEAITVTTTNTFNTSTPTFRIYRRFALPYDEHYFTYLNRLEIVAQMGVGNSAAPSPIIRIRFSKDGGSTFGDFRTMSLGAAAQYTKRAYINRVGRGRDLVAELICDDPVVVAWVQCLVEGEKATGTN